MRRLAQLRSKIIKSFQYFQISLNSTRVQKHLVNNFNKKPLGPKSGDFEPVTYAIMIYPTKCLGK